MQVGSLWLKEYNKKDGSGKASFFSGKLGYVSLPPGASIAIYKNDHKKNPSQPDYFLHVNEPFEKKQAYTEPVSALSKLDDPLDIPF